MPLRGQNNVQGSSDMGALPDTFTAYRSVGDEETARLFEERWGVTMGRERGLKMPEMLDAAIDGRIKAMWICGYDIAQSDPDVDHVVAALSNLEFLVVQEIFENETSSFAARHPPGRLLPGEVGHVHERRAAHAGRAGRGHAARRAPRPTSRSTSSSRRGSATSFPTRGPRT